MQAGTRQITYARSGYVPAVETVTVVGNGTVTHNVDLWPGSIRLTLAATSSSTAVIRRGATRRLFVASAQVPSVVLGSIQQIKLTLMRAQDWSAGLTRKASYRVPLGAISGWLADITATRAMLLRTTSTATASLQRHTSLLVRMASTTQQRVVRHIDRTLSASSGWKLFFDRPRLKLLSADSTAETTLSIKSNIMRARRLFTAAAAIIRTRHGQ